MPQALRSALWRIRRLEIADLLLAVAAVLCIANLLDLLLDYEHLVVSRHLFVDDLPRLTRSGPGLHWGTFRDVFALLQVDPRPRLLPESFRLLDFKLRAWLLSFCVPHPTFSTAWIPVLGVGSWFLYRFLLERLSDRRAALVGLILFFSSIGVLFGVADFVMPAKLMTIGIYLFAIRFAGRLQARQRPGDLIWSVPSGHRFMLAATLLAGLFTDETAAFPFAILPILFPSLFFKPGGWRAQDRSVIVNGLLFLAPVPVWAALCLAIKNWLLHGAMDPYFLYQFVERPSDIWSAPTSALTVLGFFLKHLSLRAMLDNLINYFIALPLLPAFLNPMDYGDGIHFRVPSSSVTYWSVVLVSCFCAWRVVQNAPQPRRRLLISALASGAAYVVLLSIVHFYRHQKTNGIYYGSTFAVFSSLMGCLFYRELASANGRNSRTAAAALVLFMTFTQIWNFKALNKVWYDIEITENRAAYYKIHDPSKFEIHHPSVISRTELSSLRRAWLEGRLEQYVRAHGVSSAALYFLFELRMAERI